MTPEEHTKALKEIMEHLDKEEYIWKLCAEAEAYEAEHFPIALPSIAGAIKFRLDQSPLREGNMFDIFGKERTREMMFEGVKLTDVEIKLLHEVIGIPIKVLRQKQ